LLGDENELSEEEGEEVETEAVLEEEADDVERRL